LFFFVPCLPFFFSYYFFPLVLPASSFCTSGSSVVRFREMTAEGMVRHGSFKGLREDKPAAEVGLER